jgi:paraquat-inducible protein B
VISSNAGVVDESGQAMNKRPNALRLGLFAIGGLLLLMAAIVAVFGSGLLARTEPAVMYFNGSVHGLQVGSPVVFRGVRLGRVVALGVVHDANTGVFSVPVRAEIDRSLIQDPMGQPAAGHSGLSLAQLVARGLRAQLANQSLLTGQMFIDLDLPQDGSAPAAMPTSTVVAAVPRTADGVVQIPTRASSLQGLMAQLQGLDLRGMVAEISTAAASARQLAGSPQLLKTVDELAAAARGLQTLGQSLERRVGPLADAAQATLGDTRRTVGAATVAVDKVGVAAERVGGAAGRVDGLLAADSPLLTQVQRAADELARSAVALRQATAEDGPAAQNLERTLQDVSRASRAVRDLADMLERQPEALLRGRSNAP